jgi:CBS-domain-containing membrane protein
MAAPEHRTLVRPETGPFSAHHKLCFGALCAGFTCIFALASLAMLTHAPLIFPSLGATVFLLLSAWKTEAASPRNVLCGHAIAIVCGYLALLATGLTDAPPTVVQGVSGERVVAAALSLGFTGALMLLLHVPHAPAGATTLIVSLGLVGQPLPVRLLVVEGAVALLVAMAFVLHRCRGRPYPLWRHPRTETFAGGVP